MRPSLSVTLEPGLERGVPWGRDLYTFVTSAAGHMMRTLQKTRKNRPSKRQVNHRRFLHNMIQRKFADIEASNQQLPSALNEKEKNTNTSSFSSQKTETLDQPGLRSEPEYSHNPHPNSPESLSNLKSSICGEAGINEEKQGELGHLWKSKSSICTAGKADDSKGRSKEGTRHDKKVDITRMSSLTGTTGSDLCHTERNKVDHQLNLSNNSSEAFGFTQIQENLDGSPPFSPLSIDSCDFSLQLFKDVSLQKSVTDISESQWKDILDLFSVDSKELGSCMDVEAYLENICASQGDAAREANVVIDGFEDQSESVSGSQVEDLHSEGGEYRCEYGFRDYGDPDLTGNQTQRPNTDSAESQFSISNSSFSCHYNHSETFQQGPCLLVSCENNHTFTPFEGVAQSFSVPLENPENRPIPTLPNEDDWLFTDILKDRK